MPDVEEISIALPAEMVATLRQAVDSGEYASSSEVVRKALIEWNYNRHEVNSLADIRKLVQQSVDHGGPGIPMDEVFDRLERKYQALADAAKTIT